MNNGNLRQNSITCSGHTRPVVDLKFSEILGNGTYYLITASKDGIPMLRFGHTGDWIGSFVGHKGAVWSCCLNKDGSQAATGAADFTAKIWDTESGKNTKTLEDSHIVRSVEFNRDSNMIITANNKFEIIAHDLRSDEEIYKVKGHSDTIKRATWLQNDNTILSISCDKFLKIWDIRTKSEIYQKKYDDRLKDLEIVGNYMVLATDESIILCETTLSTNENENNAYVPFTEKARWSDANSAKYNTASLHPNFNYSIETGDNVENHFVCGTDISVYKYDALTGNILDTCKGHFGPIHCIRYSPDGHLFASGSEDGTIRLWQNYLGEQYGLWYLKT